jgi:valyl-tRNA synthetase
MIDVVIRLSGTSGAAARTLLEQELPAIGRLTRSEARIADSAPEGAAAHAVLAGGTEVSVPLAGLVDVEKECARLRDEVAGLQKQIVAREGRLANAKYVERAPANVVASDRAILEEMKAKREQLSDKVRSLCGV